MYLHEHKGNSNGGFMKSAIDVRVILGLGLLALGGARATPATEVVADGQEQARLLLSGGRDSRYGPEPGLESPSSAATKSIVLDAQAQAREMIVGRQIAKKQVIDADGLRAESAAGDRKVAPDPHEVARQMILGSRSVGSSPKIRLTGKTEQLKRRP
jgi:hypothetical protein